MARCNKIIKGLQPETLFFDIAKALRILFLILTGKEA